MPTLTNDETNTATGWPDELCGSVHHRDFGKDGFKDTDDNDVQDTDAISYALGVTAPNVASGLTDTLSGDAVAELERRSARLSRAPYGNRRHWKFSASRLTPIRVR